MSTQCIVKNEFVWNSKYILPLKHTDLITFTLKLYQNQSNFNKRFTDFQILLTSTITTWLKYNGNKHIRKPRNVGKTVEMFNANSVP